jgi:hypothetical protein
MPEDPDGLLPVETDADDPDAWRDICDDPPSWGDDDG